MKIKALTSFAGQVSMHEGQTRTCEETEIVKKLIEVGYVEVLGSDSADKNEATQKASKKK